MSAPVAVDQFRRRTLLGSTATYRVAALEPGHAVVEVVDAPGLPVGMRVRLGLEDVAAMEVVDLDAELGEGVGALLAGRPRQTA